MVSLPERLCSRQLTAAVGLQSDGVGPAAIVDSHFHLWRRDAVGAAGILAAPYLRRDYLWDDYGAATSGLPVEQSVFCHVNDFVDGNLEVEFASRVARAHPSLEGMVAWAQIESVDLEQQLDRLAGPFVRGVRRSTQYEADPRFCTRPAFVTGARRLGERRLVCELCVRGEQVLGVVELAGACPETTIVLDHLGKPNMAAPEPGWRQGIAELGKCPNVSCKVSVVVHTADDPRLDRRLAEPVVGEVIESFGWDRVLFGSNWPVATAVIDYREWIEVLEQVLAGSSADQLQRLFTLNARRVYRF
jgi:L-fuconolactonase